MTSSIMKTLQIRKPTSLPVSSTAADEPGLLRRRLSSLSLNLTRNQPSTVSRSKSVSDMGEQGGSSVKEWWEWSWSWILLRKLPIFEVNKNESKSSMGSFIHVFIKLRSEIRRLLRPSSDSLPLSCKQGQR
ncbi:hypothetical protein V5N11_005909 [Cardamine amara subsp. amara]|uniref:Uncharacterized protein n=1 Tax=Cardamine amara subsp. amara TaxID=228776 RepID=A0ABD0Z188_CARAN